MQEFAYLLCVNENEELLIQVARHLNLSEAPRCLRVGTISPLNTFGYAPQAEASVLTWGEKGLTLGVAEDPSVPRIFVPWHNIAYVADGDFLREFTEFRNENPEATIEDFRQHCDGAT